MQLYIPGQRWISDAELQMGLGTVISTEGRTVTVLFNASNETRLYSQQTAPLTRVRFTQGDRVPSHEGWFLTVDTVLEESGLLIYSGSKDDGSKAVLPETDLDNFIQLNRPIDRLFTGQIDKDKWFELRYQTRLHNQRNAGSELTGLIGARTSLIPHQMYIAHEVANRYSPRILLADEVGLGKTIEAGLILHHQLHTERAQRVLIVVPETLLHQWLVEMLRRFNLHFSVFDEKRCQSIEGQSEDDEAYDDVEYENPFLTEQLVLCHLNFFLENPERHQQALDAGWDLLIIDEAHHLQWSEKEISPEYLCVEQLAKKTSGVLLLTATPEQLGKESHFARLRLLDPDRFPDLASFLDEENNYEPIAKAVESLLEGHELHQDLIDDLLNIDSDEDNKKLIATLQASDISPDEKKQTTNLLIDRLLDQHGTGRVLFRNTRETVKGFPQREVNPYTLDCPAEYKDCLNLFQNEFIADAQLLLSPELIYQAASTGDAPSWIKIDPRINWLKDKLSELFPQKVLIITSSADSALDIVDALRTSSGIQSAVFHEDMSIIERDRAAAYFADKEFGCQVLVCSEIGSEGRNFQFAHHLVLFDLPLNPDLLEQRIGRLDRIGQQETIQIHLPYLLETAQHTMFDFYQLGLNAFAHTCPIGHSVFTHVEQALIKALHHGKSDHVERIALIEDSKNKRVALVNALHKGRDRLLEYNSCRPHIAQQISEKAIEADDDVSILPYLEDVFDCFGIESEEHGMDSMIIRPGDHMQTGSFPGLYEEGMTITWDRVTALSNEDIHYLTWEHPMVSGAMDLVLNNEQGNTAVTSIKHAKIKPGTMLLECIFILETASNSKLQSSRYLPATSIRTLIDGNKNNCNEIVSHRYITQNREHIKKKMANQVINAYADEIRDLIKTSEQLANLQAPEILKSAHKEAELTLSAEINRLKALKKINPNVRQEELSFFEHQYEALNDALDSSSLRLDALRIVIVT
ncbi:MAG: RNA polymerase-associated protein RapA [Gammaproteobacteria bacterium]|nr:RNA polymerase-associated protein RapA [Gammaproteobacteria bacterium]